MSDELTHDDLLRMAEECPQGERFLEEEIRQLQADHAAAVAELTKERDRRERWPGGFNQPRMTLPVSICKASILNADGDEIAEVNLHETGKAICEAVNNYAELRAALAASQAELREERMRPANWRTFADRAADKLALAVFDWIERGLLQTRTTVSDALESWAACRFDVRDGTEIQKLREFAGKTASQAE